MCPPQPIRPRLDESRVMRCSFCEEEEKMKEKKKEEAEEKRDLALMKVSGLVSRQSTFEPEKIVIFEQRSMADAK